MSAPTWLETLADAHRRRPLPAVVPQWGNPGDPPAEAFTVSDWAAAVAELRTHPHWGAVHAGDFQSATNLAVRLRKGGHGLRPVGRWQVTVRRQGPVTVVWVRHAGADWIGS